jgi:iron complex transport system ATP-binding protein
MSELVLSDVAVSYGEQRAVLAFNDRVDAGDWVGLIGPNGAGKSSLLRAIAGLVDHDGTITVGGDDLARMSDRERARNIAYVPQEPLIPNDMTVSDYVLLGRSPYIGYWSTESKHDRRVIADVLDQLRLADFALRPLGALSGGERQRVVLARALAQQTPILLLDEPTSALDIGHQQQALELVTELRREQSITVISALHDLTLAGTYTDRLVMLHEGQAVASGPAAEVLTAERLGEVYHVCVTVDVDPDDGAVIVVPRRGFPVGPPR